MSEAYYRKWRPLDWKSVIGQDHVVKTLRNAILQDRIAHAYLFSGPRGTGKTSTARIIAKVVNCLEEDKASRPCNQCAHCQSINTGRFLDLIEIDAASNTSVDDIRALREKINFSPTHGTYKVYIIDEVHMLSNAAFNALLKTLEEPPGHAIFVLATTEVHKIPATVLSRCQRHEFRRIPLNSILVNLKMIAHEEGISVEPAALTEIARQATGSMRDAVSLLDQLASTGNTVSLDYTKEVLGTAGNEYVTDLIGAVIKKDTGDALSIINRALDNGSDPRQFGRQIVDCLRNILLVKMHADRNLEVSQEMAAQLSSFAKRMQTSFLLSAIALFDAAAQSTNLGWQPALQLEMAVMQMSESHSTERNAKKELHQPEKDAPNNKIPSKHSPKKSVKKSENSSDVSSIKTDKQSNKQNKKLTSAEKEIDIEKNGIEPYWNDIKQKAKEMSAETAALLNSCKSVRYINGVIVVSFSSSILQSKMENGNNKEIARRVVGQYFGKEIAIRCEVVGKNGGPTPKIDPKIDQNGMIGEALSLGGKMSKEE